jgi:hypothetical protein
MAEASNTILETGDGIEGSVPGQLCKTNNGKKLAWFDRKVKAKLTVVGIILVTVAFYIIIIFKLPLEYFTYYALCIASLVGAINISDAVNTYSQSRYLGNSPNIPSNFQQPGVTLYDTH